MLLEDSGGDKTVVAKAVKLFEEAALLGNRLAMFNMGVAATKGHTSPSALRQIPTLPHTTRHVSKIVSD